MTSKNTGAGLRGQSAGETAVCTVGAEGNSLRYRGFSVEDLAGQSTFNEVAYLILKGELPDQDQLDAYSSRLRSLRELPDVLC
jgi:2-methylcitrate synthase